jgi:hypothetical protein
MTVRCSNRVRRDAGQRRQSMECFMSDAAPAAAEEG